MSLKMFTRHQLTGLARDPLKHLGPLCYGHWIVFFADLASHQGVAKGSKKVAQQSPSKSQVAFRTTLSI
ncbi:hypothetical protein OIU74_003518 [Salix koriyanagi]|uniref:Uncharacterized protein n=2 Tax=Salix TaxID=40685 RepID=A0A9Q0UXZ5_9ROSI|nr:hypothetical protein OIU74_003518 [Salix koriyanagi]